MHKWGMGPGGGGGGAPHDASCSFWFLTLHYPNTVVSHTTPTLYG